jgi:hypothetical protein
MSKYQARRRRIRISPTIDGQSSNGSAGSDTELEG